VGASFEPLTTTIGPTGRPVARRMKPWKREKIDAWGWQFHACADTPLWTDWPQNLHMGWGPRRNQLCQFFVKGLGAGISRKTAFPIESVHRPYNSVSTTVLHCDEFITDNNLAYVKPAVIRDKQHYVCSENTLYRSERDSGSESRYYIHSNSIFIRILFLTCLQLRSVIVY